MHPGLEDRARDTGKAGQHILAERARGGVGPIITGGYAPNRTGLAAAARRGDAFRRPMRRQPRRITTAVARRGGRQDRAADPARRALRAAHHPLSVSASSIKAPINPFSAPRRCVMCPGTISDFVARHCWPATPGTTAWRSSGSEGYLLNQFLAPRTNKRRDEWGRTPRSAAASPCRDRAPGSRGGRVRIFILVYRISVADYPRRGRPDLG